MVKKRKLLFWTVCVFAMCFLISFLYGFWGYKKTVNAVAGFPYQIGLLDTLILPCTLNVDSCTNSEPLAAGTCKIKTPADCLLYSYVTGQPAGGDGNFALMNNIILGKIGLTQGGAMIAGFNSPVSTDTGVSASYGGAYMMSYRKIDSAIDFVTAAFHDKNN